MNAIKLFHSARHTKPKQLSHRIRLTLKRKLALKNASSLKKEFLNASIPELSLKADLPILMPMRTRQFKKADGRYSFCFLNHTESFSELDWQPKHVSHLWLFNLHYMEYLEGLNDELFVELVESWLQNNPPYEARYWAEGWNAFVLSIRIVVWMQQLNLRPQLNDTFKTKVLNSIVQQSRFLSNNLELDLTGNHLLKNIKALLWAGAYFDMPEATDWLELGQKLLKEELAEQILDDGLHFERSPSYHAQVFVDLLECYVCLPNNALKASLYERLACAAQALADTTHPDELPSLFNDGGLHMAYSPQACLAAWQKLSNEPTKARSVFALKDAGYFGLRTEDLYFIVDAGDMGPAYLPGHAHGDIFSFELSLKGKRVIVDAGTFEYSQGAKRDYARSTKAHNTVTLDNQDQAEFWSAFRVARRAKVSLKNYQAKPEGFSLTAQHDGFSRLKGQAIHERHVEVSPKSIRIKDAIQKGDGQTVTARLLLHPDCYIQENAEGYLITRDDAQLRLKSKARISLEDASYYPDFGLEFSAKQLILHYGVAPCEAEFSLEVS